MIKISSQYFSVPSYPKSEEIAASNLFERTVMVALPILYYLPVVCLHALHHALNIFFLSSVHVGSCFLVQLVQLSHSILLNLRIGRT